MVHYEEYRRAAQFLEVLQTLSVFRRSESVVFRSESSEVVGRLAMVSGRVCAGVEIDGQLYLDQAFRTEAPQYAAALAAALADALGGEALTPEQAELLAQPSLSDRVALGGLTARAIRCLAARCYPDSLTILPPQPRSGLPGSAVPSFTPSELLLAAGRRSGLVLDNLAVRLYGTPPGPAAAQERWLFEMQPAVGVQPAPWPWPVMTTRISTRRIEDIALFGELAQQLIPRLQERSSGMSPQPVHARVLQLDRRLLYQICTERYATILVYDVAQLESVLRSLDELVNQGPRSLEAVPLPSDSVPELVPVADSADAEPAVCPDVSQTVSIIDAEIPLAPPPPAHRSDPALSLILSKERDSEAERKVASHALDGGVRVRAQGYVSRPQAAAKSAADVRR